MRETLAINELKQSAFYQMMKQLMFSISMELISEFGSGQNKY